MGPSSQRRARSQRHVLEHLRSVGPATRADLAEVTGLSRSAVATVVGKLLDAGLVVADGAGVAAPGARGRRSDLLVASESHGTVLAIDYGHAHVRVALADTHGAVLDEQLTALDVDNKSDEAFGAAVSLADQLLDNRGLTHSDLRAVGVGIPGPLDVVDGVLRTTTILGRWRGRAPAEELRSAFGVPVRAENDANLGALGEQRYGAARGMADFVYVKIASGIGAGIFTDGRLVRGARGFAGGLGHTQLQGATQRCPCGKQGCLEAVVSVSEIQRQLSGTHLAAGTGTPVIAEAGLDPVGARILADAGRTVGRLLADGCNWLNPEAVVLGGEIGISGASFTDGVAESLRLYIQPAIGTGTAVLAAGLGSRSEIMGAVAAAIDEAARPTRL